MKQVFNMNKIITILPRLLLVVWMGCMLAWVTGVSASEGTMHLEKSPHQLCDKGSLQRGAKLYVNLCQGCHSLQYVRYKNLAKDIGITDGDGKVLEELVKKDLNFVTDNVNDPMVNSMPKDLAKKWFGVAPPDLSLTSRVRGTDWIYTYLKSFYIDDRRPWGVNNLVFPMVAMPNVLEHFQGKQVIAEGSAPHAVKLVLEEPGSMSAEEYSQAVTDIVNFLDYVGEPVKLKRQKIGVGVMVFLIIFLVFAYLLKREYWKDVH